MPFIPILKPVDASAETRTVYEEFYRRMSFPSPPNFIMTQGHSPTVARGTWSVVQNVLVLGEIPRWKKEMMFAAISKDRGCRYADAARELAHDFFAHMLAGGAIACAEPERGRFRSYLLGASETLLHTAARRGGGSNAVAGWKTFRSMETEARSVPDAVRVVAWTPLSTGNGR